MAERDLEYGVILVIASVVFLMSGMDLLEPTLFSKGFSTLMAFILVAIGTFLIGKSGK